MVLLAQISDLHLDGTARASDRAARTVGYLRGLRQLPDAVLVTGDIADTAARSEYTEAARLLDLPVPVLPAPGNHDRRPAYRAALLGEPPSDEPINRVHDVGDVSVLMCDSTIPGRDDGRLDAVTLSWIDTTLADRRDRPALLAFHHPPTVLHHPLPDASRLGGASDLAALLGRHPQVVALITGHAHTAAATVFAGRPVIVGPAVTWTLRMPWEGSEVADRQQPPGIAFHVVTDRTLVTHFRAVT
ncbi:metallophosphoesterase [Virgisporangium aurantiacum]|uniref:3',5'-cyclic adenosine monophosphate phosphodiesterase CpdA n=1 Tax=Virgisporangium aurantiacum TaxID=175570 RepID=A0A8J3YZ34_9ACTN|nr:metallophosphoesterase [Virgisporangium aurantiacum]GIJ53313.1 3',5'-cyclic adenosine monophosphate phosphodiesterase CpdA [Virgisporangium aurantiacum]